jgi:aspartate kinase
MFIYFLMKLKTYHFEILHELFNDDQHPVFDAVNNTFVEIDWILEDEPIDSYDFIYDQIVSIGELVSTQILSHYLNFVGIKKYLVRCSLIYSNR